MIKVFLADDHALLREALREKLCRGPNIKCVGEADATTDLLPRLRATKPDVLLLDIKFGDGSALTLLPAIRRACSKCAIVMLTMYDHPRYLRHAFQMGVRGYVVKGDSFEELVRAIRLAAKGNQYVSVSMRDALVDVLTDKRSRTIESLSRREFEVLVMLGSGMSCKEIAAELSLSEKTVSTYRGRILSKLGLRNRAELIRYALESGLVT